MPKAAKPPGRKRRRPADGVGGRLQAARRAAHLTQLQLATAAGCTRATVAGIEANHYGASHKLLEKLAEALETSSETLRSGDERPREHPAVTAARKSVEAAVAPYAAAIEREERGELTIEESNGISEIYESCCGPATALATRIEVLHAGSAERSDGRAATGNASDRVEAAWLTIETPEGPVTVEADHTPAGELRPGWVEAGQGGGRVRSSIGDDAAWEYWAGMIHAMEDVFIEPAERRLLEPRTARSEKKAGR